MAASNKRKSLDGSLSSESSSDEDTACSTSSHLQVELNKRTVRTSHGSEGKSPGMYLSYSCKKCLFWCVSPDPECISKHLADAHPYCGTVSLPREGNYMLEKSEQNASVRYTYHCLHCSFNFCADMSDSSQMTQHFMESHKDNLIEKSSSPAEEVGKSHSNADDEVFEQAEIGVTPCVATFVKCVSCDFIHPRYESVVSHYAVVHTTPRYLCKACLKAYHNLAQFTIHLHTKHPTGLSEDQIVLPESHLEGKQVDFILEGPGDIYDKTLGDYLERKTRNNHSCNGIGGHSKADVKSMAVNGSRSDNKPGSKSLKELLSAKPMSFNIEASIFFCKYNKACRFSSPNRTELVLNHILTEHKDILSPATVVALKMAVRSMYDTKPASRSERSSVSSGSNVSSPLSKLIASYKSGSLKSRAKLRASSTSPDRLKAERKELIDSYMYRDGPPPVKIKSEPEDSESEYPGVDTTDMAVDTEGITDGSKQHRKWWQAENTCPGILLHNGLKQLSCRHQGVGGDNSDEMLMMYLCRDCGFWCFNISSDCILQHVRVHMATARLAQHWDREGPRFAELVPVKPEELSPRRNWRRDPFAFFARVPVPRVSGRLVFTVWVCPLCDFVHPYHNMAIVHLRIKHFNHHRVYSCSLCKYGGPSEAIMMQHFRDSHWQDAQPKTKVALSQYEQFLVYNEEEAENLESLICEAALKLVGMTMSFSRQYRYPGQAEKPGARKKHKMSVDD